jgi:2-C-methyl-D-erythritol 2,4-cyclodiphosphate synthase
VKVRIGIGFDIHRLEPGSGLTLGGVRVPHDQSLVGHSDGDALLHAITDALLGACGLGNIGEKYPDTDPRYAGVDSRQLLRDTAALVRGKGYEIGNIDSNILAERPKLLEYFPAMKDTIAEILEIPVDDVHVKAKTMEHLDAVGAGDAIAAQAIALVFIES